MDVVTRRARRIGSWPGELTADLFPQFSVAFSPDGRRLAVALANNAPYVASRCPSVSCSSTAGPDVRCGVGATRAEAARWRSSSCSAATAP